MPTIVKQVTSLDELRAIAAKKGAMLDTPGGVFNNGRKKFAFKKTAQATLPEVKQESVQQVPVAAQDATSLLAIAQNLELVALAQVEANRLLASAITARPTTWKMDVARNADGDLVSATISGI